MKTMKIVGLNPYVSRLVKSLGNDEGQILAAVNADLGRSQVTEGEGKRSDVKGGYGWKPDGTMAVKEASVRESVGYTYTLKTSAPIEFLKWNDAIGAMAKKCGAPSGELTEDSLPRIPRDWLAKLRGDAKMAKAKVKTAKPARAESAPVAPATVPA